MADAFPPCFLPLLLITPEHEFTLVHRAVCDSPDKFYFRLQFQAVSHLK